jgi:hypothetical protein
MARSIEDLEAHAEKYWPRKLTALEQDASILPALHATQEKFIGVLYVADANPRAWSQALSLTTELSGNLFLKHLIVLSDVSGEKLQRLRSAIEFIFPDGAMHYVWREQTHTYEFQSLETVRRWANPNLGVDGPGLSHAQTLQAVHEDVAMILLHGGASIDPQVPDYILDNCVIGSLLGRKPELDAFIRRRYIQVSRITEGARANSMGQLCQRYIRERLQSSLPSWNFARHSIPNISQNAGRTDISFDMVAESGTGVFCAIEVGFQVTTNSTIERKAGQAQARQTLLHANGHYIAYVIDGAGNFERRSAISAICAHSDFTVTFKDEELDKLADYLRSLERQPPRQRTRRHGS